MAKSTKQRARPPKAAGASSAAGAGQAGTNAPTDTSKIDDVCLDYQEMLSDWTMTYTLMGGTRRMRSVGQLYLPKEPGEDFGSYNVRLNRSTFFNGFARTVKALAAKPFAKPVVYSEDLDPKLQDYIKDIDRNGRHFSVFLSEFFPKALSDGMRHVLVDMPQKPETEITAADSLKNGRRPYCIEIDPRNLFFWSYEVSEGVAKLTEIRWKEPIPVADGQYGQRMQDRIRVMTPTTWQVWVLQGDEYTLDSSGTMPLGYIPLVTIYTGRSDFMKSVPPLMDLAWENVHHWQSRSDQNHILHVARVPVWFGKGLPNATAEGQKVEYRISPNTMIITNKPDADLKIVEHTGAAIEAGRADLTDSENRMAVLGTELLVNNVDQVEKSATEITTDKESQYSQLGMMVVGLEDGADTILQYMADWQKLPFPDEPAVQMYKDFGLVGDVATLQTLLAARAARDISQGTFLQELKRFGVLSAQVDVDEEMEAIQNEAPTLGTMDDDATGAGATEGAAGGPGAPRGTKGKRTGRSAAAAASRS